MGHYDDLYFSPRTYYNSTAKGIHRVSCRPYDDKILFTNIIDLLIYCKAGARYNGQQASLLFNNNQIDIIINNNQPILKFNNIEYYKKYNNKYYALLYYFNPYFNNNTGFIYDEASISINNPNRFNIINLLDVFRSNELETYINNLTNENSKLLLDYNTYKDSSQQDFYKRFFDHDFMFIRTNSSGVKSYTIFNQKVYPFITDNQSLNGTTCFKKVVDSNENNYTYFNCNIYNSTEQTNENFILFPNKTGNHTSDGYITELYIEADSYIRAILGE